MWIIQICLDKYKLFFYLICGKNKIVINNYVFFNNVVIYFFLERLIGNFYGINIRSKNIFMEQSIR